jgi:PmbA protein
MLGKDKAHDLALTVFKLSDADATEVVFSSYQSALTRFAHSAIHQNVSETNASASVRAVLGRKQGVSQTNDLSRSGLAKAVNQAIDIARHQPQNPDPIELPAIDPQSYKNPRSYDDQTADWGPVQRAETAGLMVQEVAKTGGSAFGSVSNGISETAVANSLGTFAYHIGTDIYANILVHQGDGSGYASQGVRRVAGFNPQSIARTAARKAADSRKSTPIKPGKYTVILEPLAVDDFLSFLVWTGLGAKPFMEDRSFMSARIGEKITGENITLYDDPHNTRGFPMPFDFEGVPRKKVTYINNGIAKGVVWDSYHARKYGRRSTGHALPAPATWGPMGFHLVMKPGSTSIQQMIADTEDGLLVTRFHYTNVIDPKRTIITGMTRDGLFRIKKGKVTGAVKNMRFTENIIDALSRATEIESHLNLVATGENYQGRFPTGSLVPALKIEKFNFSSKTEF